MKNIFQRNISMDSLKDKELSDYTPSELVAFLTNAYPDDPIRYMRETYKVGQVLGKQTELLLEGVKGVKTN